MVGFVLKELEELLLQCGLYHAIRVVRYGIVPSHFHFFAMLKKYNPNTCTFFTPVGEMGFALHEMFEVSGLPMGDMPCEEYIPDIEELQLLKKDAPRVYETYWESCATSTSASRRRG